MPRASVVFRTSMGGFCRVSKEGEKEEEVAGSGREDAPRVSKGVFLEVGRGAEIGVVGRWLFTVGRVSRVCVQGRGPAQRYIARVCSRVGARATARTGCGQSTRGVRVRVRTCVGRGVPATEKGGWKPHAGVGMGGVVVRTADVTSSTDLKPCPIKIFHFANFSAFKTPSHQPARPAAPGTSRSSSNSSSNRPSSIYSPCLSHLPASRASSRALTPLPAAPAPSSFLPTSRQSTSPSSSKTKTATWAQGTFAR